MMIFLLRFLLWRKRAKPAVVFCALLQDAFIAAELSLLPKNIVLYSVFFLYQWIGILLAERLNIRLTLALLPLMKHAGHFTDSAKEGNFFRWIAIGCACFWLLPQELPKIFVALGLLSGPLAVYWCRSLPSNQELASSNPLFYLQWKWWIHPLVQKSGKLPAFSFEKEEAIFLSKEFPLLRKTVRFTAPEQISIPKGGKPNILFLFLESFRAQNTGALGASISASPHLDALSQNGAFFTQCTATGPLTFYATISSLFSIQPALNTFYLQSYQETSLISLPYLLGQRGYKTAWFDGGYATFGGKLPFSRRNGVAEIFGAEELNTGKEGFSWGVHDRTMFNSAANWLKKQTAAPSFAVLFTLTNHHPWDSPSGWQFHSPQEVNPVYQHYLNTLSYTDACMGKFVEDLRLSGLLENTILFISGDHGQEMKENQNYITHVSLSQQNLHVPFLIYAPGRVKPQIIDTPCSHIDFMPTVLDLLQIEEPHHCLGRSLLRDSPQPVYFSLCSTIPRWGCRSGSYKWSGLSNGKEEELYDIDADPEEKRNLAEVLKEKGEELKKQTLTYFEGMETLFQKNAWAPSRKQESEILRTSRDITDEKLEKLLKRTFTTMDLSDSSSLTDKSIQKIAKKNEIDLSYLVMPKSPYITDVSLLAISKSCQNLVAFYSFDCPLITSYGAEAILNSCRKLKVFVLDRTDDVVFLNPRAETLSLSSLYLGEDLPIDGESLVKLLQKCPHLTYFSANILRASKQHLVRLSKLLPKLYELSLFEGKNLTDEILLNILKQSPHLSKIRITNGFHLKVKNPILEIS